MDKTALSPVFNLFFRISHSQAGLAWIDKPAYKPIQLQIELEKGLRAVYYPLSHCNLNRDVYTGYSGARADVNGRNFSPDNFTVPYQGLQMLSEHAEIHPGLSRYPFKVFSSSIS